MDAATSANAVKRYFLASTDDNRHWYIVQADKRDEWAQWLALPATDDNAWCVPDFATPLDGTPSHVTFENPIYPTTS